MVQKLTKTDRDSLAIAITEALQNGTATGKRTEIPKNWCKAAIDSFSDATKSYFKKHLDDGGIEKFVNSEIEKIHRASNVASAKDTPFKNLEHFSDHYNVAKSIVARVSDLPLQYRMVVRGPAELADRLGRDDVDIPISNQLKLVSGRIISKDIKLKHSNAQLDNHIRGSDPESDKNFVFEDKYLYFEFRTSGCISSTTDSRIVRDFLDNIRAFYGCCIAFNIIDDFDFKEAGVNPWVAANEIVGEEAELAYFARADDDIIKATNLATTKAYDDKIENNKETLEESLTQIVKMFSSQNNNKLITAAIWIFRANISNRQMDRILDSTISLEAMLGDREASDRIGLSKLMANRCAYALGKSVKERNEITEFFVEFYRVRSDIVHKGKFKLEEDEAKIVSRGMRLSERMLKHEIALIS